MQAVRPNPSRRSVAGVTCREAKDGREMAGRLAVAWPAIRLPTLRSRIGSPMGFQKARSRGCDQSTRPTGWVIRPSLRQLQPPAPRLAILELVRELVAR